MNKWTEGGKGGWKTGKGTDRKERRLWTDMEGHRREGRGEEREGGCRQTMEGLTLWDRSCYWSGANTHTLTHLHTQSHKGHSALAALQTHSCRDTDILVNTTKRHCDFSLSCLFSTHWTDLPFKHIQDQHNCTYKTTCMKMQSKESVEYYNSHIKCASHYAPNFKAFLPKRMTPVSLICDLWLAY